MWVFVVEGEAPAVGRGANRSLSTLGQADGIALSILKAGNQKA